MTTMTRRGEYIVVEGPDKNANTLQARTLTDRLLDQSIASRYVHEPCELPSSGFSSDARTELLRLTACRLEIFNDEIKPALQAGEIVIADGNWLSSLARQGMVQNLGGAAIRELCREQLHRNYLHPDFVVMLWGSARADKDLVQAYDTIGPSAAPKFKGTGFNFSYVNLGDNYEKANDRIVEKLTQAKVIPKNQS